MRTALSILAAVAVLLVIVLPVAGQIPGVPDSLNCLLKGGKWVNGACVMPTTPSATVAVEKTVTLEGSAALPVTNIGKRAWDKLTIKLQTTLGPALGYMAYAAAVAGTDRWMAREVIVGGRSDLCALYQQKIDSWPDGMDLEGFMQFPPSTDGLFTFTIWHQLTPAKWDELAALGAVYCVAVAPVGLVGISKLQGACFKVEQP